MLFSKVANDKHLSPLDEDALIVITSLTSQCLANSARNLASVDRHLADTVYDYLDECDKNLNELLSGNVTIGEYNKLAIYDHINYVKHYGEGFDKVAAKLSVPANKSTELFVNISKH